MVECRALEVIADAGWYVVVLAGDCGADVLARFTGLPVTLMAEAWRVFLP